MEISGNYRVGVYIDEITEGLNDIFSHILKVQYFPSLVAEYLDLDLENTFDNYGISTEYFSLKRWKEMCNSSAQNVG